MATEHSDKVDQTSEIPVDEQVTAGAFEGRATASAPDADDLTEFIPTPALVEGGANRNRNGRLWRIVTLGGVAVVCLGAGTFLGVGLTSPGSVDPTKPEGQPGVGMLGTLPTQSPTNEPSPSPTPTPAKPTTTPTAAVTASSAAPAPTTATTAPPPPQPSHENEILRGPNGAQYYIKNGQRHVIPNPAISDCIRVRAGTGDQQPVSEAVINGYPSGPTAYCLYEINGSGKLNFVKDRDVIWYVMDGTRRLVISGLCTTLGYSGYAYDAHTVPDTETEGHANIGTWSATPDACNNVPR